MQIVSFTQFSETQVSKFPLLFLVWKFSISLHSVVMVLAEWLVFAFQNLDQTYKVDKDYWAVLLFWQERGKNKYIIPTKHIMWSH